MAATAEHFAGLMGRLSDRVSMELLLAAQLLGRKTGEGHVCLNLAKLAGTEIPLDLQGGGLKSFPELSVWESFLEKSGVVGRPGDFFPMILDREGRLYLQRYWQYEQVVASFVEERGQLVIEPDNPQALRAHLARLFPAEAGVVSEVDWQKVAVVAAATRAFCVITGGPGTGKTTTVAKILALLLGRKNSGNLRIAMAAPTGKAAARLQEAIQAAKNRIDMGERAAALIPAQATTLHRLLGGRHGSPFFRHDAANPLPYDIIVVDEASMVDLPLMAKLMQAVPKVGRLILLGDRNQLASVEPGSVLGDLCPPSSFFSREFSRRLELYAGVTIPEPYMGAEEASLADSVVDLRKNFRFLEESGIHQACRAISSGDAAQALAVLTDDDYPDVRWRDIPSVDQLGGAIEEFAGRGVFGPGAEARPAAVFGALEGRRMLCALRQGPYGATAVNRMARRIMGERTVGGSVAGLYAGLPIMIVRNDYDLGLFNGDVGLVVSESGSVSGTTVLFPDASGEGYRRVSPSLLPSWEPVYAMTVHKSQGMEFDHVVVMLADRSSPVLTKELLYTALSRARQSVEVWGRCEVFEEAVGRQITRESGLAAGLWGGGQAL